MLKKIIIISIAASVIIGAGLFYMITREPKENNFYHDPGNYFVTDIADSRRLLKSDIIISCSGDYKSNDLVKENHRIRDIIIFTLREKTESDLQTNGIKELLNEEIIQKLNDAFETDAFKKLYFNEFVIQ